MTTTEAEEQRIARECADTIRPLQLEAEGEPGISVEEIQERYAVNEGELQEQERVKRLILTAAHRIAALKVKESGAVEALESCERTEDGDRYSLDYDEVIVAKALTALRQILEDGQV